MPQHRRRFRLILPRVQLRLIGALTAVAALALLLEYILMARSVMEMASELPHDRDVLIALASSSMAWVLGLALALLLPTLFVVAVLVSHRFCGPIYRFQMYLKAVLAGDERGECRLRKGDDLQELCDLINRSTAAARATPVGAGRDGSNGAPPSPDREVGRRAA